MATVLITGANRGIGLEFVRQYLAEGWQVLACYRAPVSEALTSLMASHAKQLRLFEMDVSQTPQIHALAKQLSGVSIDVLINNAGVYPESAFSEADEAAWHLAFQVNTIAPFKMAQAFTSHLTQSKLPKLVTLSSKMGSIDDNSSGGSYIYRTTKTAANMVMKSLSVDLAAHGIACVTLHPGWVLTDMGGPHALINTQTSVTGMRNVIAQLSLSNTGQFIAYDGKAIPW